MIKEDITHKIGKPMTLPLTIVIGIFILFLISSPFIWIWLGFALAWKVGLTGLIGIMISNFFLKVINKAVSSAVDSAMKRMEEGKPKSKFQERLEKMVRKRLET